MALSRWGIVAVETMPPREYVLRNNVVCHQNACSEPTTQPIVMHLAVRHSHCFSSDRASFGRNIWRAPVMRPYHALIPVGMTEEILLTLSKSARHDGLLVVNLISLNFQYENRFSFCLRVRDCLLLIGSFSLFFA